MSRLQTNSLNHGRESNDFINCSTAPLPEALDTVYAPSKARTPSEHPRYISFSSRVSNCFARVFSNNGHLKLLGIPSDSFLKCLLVWPAPAIHPTVHLGLKATVVSFLCSFLDFEGLVSSGVHRVTGGTDSISILAFFLGPYFSWLASLQHRTYNLTLRPWFW
jgi:hypothetical protein